MKSKIEKAKATSNAKITFVSLVDKADNKKQILITKSANGSANFQTYGRIILHSKAPWKVTTTTLKQEHETGDTIQMNL